MTDNMLRISATVLEAFRLYMEPEQDWMSKQALVDQICGKFVTRPEIEIGLAFGDIVRDPEKFRVRGGFKARDYCFDGADMAEPLAAIQIPGSTFEVKGHRVYDDAVVVSKADQLLGARLREFKTTGYFDFEKYSQSLQWRFMVDALGPAFVEYLVFVVDDHENGVVGIKEAHQFRLYPYPELHADCERWVRDFRAFVDAEGLAGFLREQQARFGDRGVAALL